MGTEVEGFVMVTGTLKYRVLVILVLFLLGVNEREVVSGKPDYFWV